MNGESSLACGPWTCPILRPCLTAGRAWPGGCIRPPGGPLPWRKSMPKPKPSATPMPASGDWSCGLLWAFGGGPPLLSSIPAGAGANQRGRAVLRAMDTDLPVVTKPAHGRGIPLAELEARCTRLLRPVPEAHLPLWMGVDTFSGHPLKRKGDWTNHLKHATISLPFGPT